jgi:nucleotide-binding universal stress UspA family protein
MEAYMPTGDLDELVKTAKQKSINKQHRFKAISTVNTLSEGISEHVIALGIDLILMGTIGAKGLEQFFLGSNTVTIINKVRNCPVIVVPRTYTISKNPRQVVFSTNFKRPFKRTELQPLLDLMLQWRAELKIVQLMDEAHLDDKQKLHRDALVHLLGEIPHFFHKIVYETSETNAIRDFVAETQSDMIALIYHKQSFFYDLLQENVVEKIAFNSSVPLFVLRGVH